MRVTMVLNTQMMYLFSYKMFIRYLYINVYTCKAEKKDPSQRSSRSFAGGSSPWVKAAGFEANKHLTSCLITHPLFTMALGKGMKKDGQETLRPGSRQAC